MIGIYGGTFDPIHFGHLRPVLDIVEALDLDKCHFIPCSVPHHRLQPHASSAQRVEMVATAIKNEARFYLNLSEINREGISYTFDTVEHIKSEVKDNQKLCLIIGIDAFSKFDKWYRWRDILDLCHIIVSHRPGWDVDSLLVSNQFSKELVELINSSRIESKGDLMNSQAGKILFKTVTQLDISATKIRDYLYNNKSIQYLLPTDVANIINTQKIYVK